MRKFRSLIAFFMVILIQITPWPLGLRPAHANPAVLVPIAVGALISGTLVAGAGVYSQQVYSAANTVVDSVSGNVSRSVLVAKMFGVGAEAVAYGVAGQVGLGFQQAKDWIESHPLDFPSISPAFQKCVEDVPLTPIPGLVFTWDGVKKQIVTLGAPYSGRAGISPPFTPYPWPYNLGGGVYLNSTQNAIAYDLRPDDLGYPGVWSWTQANVTWLTTALPITVPQKVIKPENLAPWWAHSPATEAEIDRLIREHPPVVIAKPQPLPAPAISIPNTIPWPLGVPIPLPGQPITIPEILPGTPTIQIPVTIEQPTADSPPYITSGTPESQPDYQPKEEELTPDIPYNPNSLNGPYTLPEVDFAERLRQFITSCKSSSIFSLPSAVLGNVPAAGTSTMTIQGGQIFGTHVFDFADLSSMWNVLRGIILTGFSFIAVRVVTLKK